MFSTKEVCQLKLLAYKSASLKKVKSTNAIRLKNNK